MNISTKNNVLVAVAIFTTMLFSVTLSAKEVLIVDKGVSDYQFFIDHAKKSTDIILLESNKDGLSQMTSALHNYKG